MKGSKFTPALAKARLAGEAFARLCPVCSLLSHNSKKHKAGLIAVVSGLFYWGWKFHPASLNKSSGQLSVICIGMFWSEDHLSQSPIQYSNYPLWSLVETNHHLLKDQVLLSYHTGNFGSSAGFALTSLLLRLLCSLCSTTGFGCHCTGSSEAWPWGHGPEIMALCALVISMRVCQHWNYWQSKKTFCCCWVMGLTHLLVNSCGHFHAI